MKFTAAPFFGSDIGDGLRKVPAVAVKVLSVVLALAIRLILGFRQDGGSVLSRSVAVSLGIFDANLNDVRVIRYHVAFGDREAPIAGFHLDAMIGDAEADGEAKSLRQPVSRCAGVGVNEYRNNGTGWDGPVGSHLDTLPPDAQRIEDCGQQEWAVSKSRHVTPYQVKALGRRRAGNPLDVR
jgi:hypothetical protein